MKHALITGSNGFVGRATVEALLDAGFAVRAGVRNANSAGIAARTAERVAGVFEIVEYGDIGPNTDWSNALEGIDCVIHLAGRAHIMRDKASFPLAEFRRINVEGTLCLARQAVARGVKRFIYVSSIKVNGERSSPGCPFSPDDRPQPTDPYGVSKFEAEQGLRELERSSELEVVIVRPVLVYGPGVKANFRTMMRVLRAGLPLPLGGLVNRRSLVGLGNLTSLLAACAQLEKAAHQTFLISDGEDLSTSDLLRRMAVMLNRPARLLNVPGSVLEAVARLLGKGEFAQRLCGSLQVDSSKTCATLGWSPPFSVDDELKRTVDSFLAERGGR